jgi:hypothetical protein
LAFAASCALSENDDGAGAGVGKDEDGTDVEADGEMVSLERARVKTACCRLNSSSTPMNI